MSYHRHLQSYAYDTNTYDFKAALCKIFDIDDVDYLHCHELAKARPLTHDSSSPLHSVFYSRNSQLILKEVYFGFLSQIVYPLLEQPFYYQAIPCIRIGMPGRRWLDRYHKDSEYNHPIQELNINLPISVPCRASCLRIELTPGKQDFVYLDGAYGRFTFIDHINCMHGSDVNSSSKSFLSLDFRLIPESLSKEAFSDSSSVNKLSKMRPGSYFSEFPLTGL